jgi:DNA mismatch repair protein MutS
LGDELCAGTESVSAQALVASGIQWLSKHNAKFIFATHLHDLPEILDMDELRVSVWHLHVDYDPITKKLVYDRTLRPGSGSSMYGLEVARAMDLPFDFIEQALQNRHKITGSKRINESETSSWNRQINRKECELCKSQFTSDLEVHHIIPRSSASKNILEDGTHMNNSSNLIVICQKCHDSVHRDEIIIGDVKITSNGPEREIQYKSDTQETRKKSKWTDDEMEIITQTVKKYTSLSLKSIRCHLETNHSVRISEIMLGKIRKAM